MTAEEKVLAAGFEDVLLFSNFSYDSALIGITVDNRAVYDFDKMVNWLKETEGFDEIEAVEWIEYNTIRSLPYSGEAAPVVMYAINEMESYQ